MAMNRVHRWGCASRPWSLYVSRWLLPWALTDVDLGPTTLEFGPGFGANMEPLLARTGRLTSVEIDGSSARRLQRRFGDRAEIIEADGTESGLPDASFGSVVCFSVMHHVPTGDGQDLLLAEAHRMLTPGGVFAGSDGLHSTAFRLLHIGDTYNPLATDDLPDRLSAAGFVDVEIDTAAGNQRWRAVKPTA
ncbi:class I SAM-dependent methyltransferase [Gordonia sp. CPCC 206044]|uniref:class I SAM-dependent methyltransferase n=1 Tax=Gordonia sp. CPCC 206044 TaxID=3140793 RepID=UPI003AF3A65A